MKKFSLEIIRNRELVENSALYFENEEQVLNHAEAALLEADEELYVTYFEEATGVWYYDQALTEKANSLVSRF